MSWKLSGGTEVNLVNQVSWSLVRDFNQGFQNTNKDYQSLDSDIREEEYILSI
jgi:hypothetical protein